MVSMMCKGGVHIVGDNCSAAADNGGGRTRVVVSLSNLAVWCDKGVFASRNFF